MCWFLQMLPPANLVLERKTQGEVLNAVPPPDSEPKRLIWQEHSPLLAWLGVWRSQQQASEWVGIPTCPSPSSCQNCQGGKLFLYLLRTPNYTNKRQINRRKKQTIIINIYMHLSFTVKKWNSHQGLGLIYISYGMREGLNSKGWQIVGKRLGNIWGKLMEEKGYCSKVCLCKLMLGLTCPLRWEESLFSSWYRREGAPSSKGNVCLAFRQRREGREFSPHLLILSYLQLEVILMSKWHVLGQHILIPFRVTLSPSV